MRRWKGEVPGFQISENLMKKREEDGHFFLPAVEREGVKNSVYAVDTPIRRGEL